MKKFYLSKATKERKRLGSFKKFIRTKALPTALVIFIATQLVSPFFVAYADVNRNGLINNNNGPSKSNPTGETKTVSSWDDLKKLGTMDGNVLVISGNYTIKLTDDVIACCPVKITGNVHISADSEKTIFRQKGNTNFSVFTVDGGNLTLGKNIIMTGDVAESYQQQYKITVTDAYGTVLYEETVHDDDTRTPAQILSEKNILDRDQALDLIKSKTQNDSDSPYSLGYKLKTNYWWDMASQRDTQMNQLKKDLLIVAGWDDPDKNKVLYVVDGYGNEIYRTEVLHGSTKTPRDLLDEAQINDRGDNQYQSKRDATLKSKLENVDGPYKLGYTFDGWNLNDEGMKQFKNIDGDFYVVAKWIGVYKITITDGYETVLDTITVPANSTMTPKDILEEKGYYTREQAESLIASKTANDPTSPYSLGYLLLGNNAHWDMYGMRTTQMKDVGGDLLITAKWDVPEKNLNLRVTDGAGNTIFTSTDKSKTIQQLMADNRLNANAADQSATEKTAIANKVGSSAESPANDTNYSFNSWDFGGVDKTKTLAEIDGNVVVCAAWNPPGEVEYVWEVPNPIEEGMEIVIGIGGKFMGVNANGNTQWENNYNSNNEKWVIANVQGNTFEIVNKAHPTEKLWVKQSANNGYNAQDEGGFKYSTGADANPTQAYTRFSFATINNESYLACVGEFQHYQGQYPTKTVYMVGNPGNQAIFFSDNAGLGAAVHVGKPTKKYDNPDTPGKTDVPGPGTPGGSEQVAGVTPAVGPTDNDPNDAPGTIGHNTATGQVPQTTKTKQNAGTSNVDTVDNPCCSLPIKTSEDVRYTRGGANNTQVFVKDGDGFFVQVNDGGTLDIEGAVLTDVTTGRIDNNGNYVNDTSVRNSAPVVVNGGTMHFTDGQIRNNRVGYGANDQCSGMQVQGRNSDSNQTGCNFNGVEDYIKKTPMTNTAGAIIFKNGAKGEITGNASIRENRGDSGGIIVQNEKTDVTIGGSVVYNETTAVPEDGAYFVLGTDGHYYSVNSNNSELNEKMPAGVSRVDDKMYDASIESGVGGGHIDNNIGFHHAGAALVEDGATLRMVGDTSTMNNNVTWAKGGAVWATEFGTSGYAQINYREKRLVNTDVKQANEEGVFIMTSGTIDNNTAFVRGGGLNVESDHVFLIGGTISNNNSRALGGGIYVEGDFPDYTYTLVINKGYVGHNYAVRYWNLNEFADAENNVGGSWDTLNLSQLNDRLDRRIGSTNNELITNPVISDTSATLNSNHRSPLNDASLAKGNGYPNRTADTLAYPNPHEGNGGGIWLCPIGGTAVFHMNADNEVIIDDNYASGRFSNDKTKGTDLYLHSGTGHMLVQNETGVADGQAKEQWYNELTGEQIPDNSPVYSGPLYLINNTPDGTTYVDSNGNETTYAQRKAKDIHDGIHIIDNISRDGGGIAANGTLLFGLPNDVYRHEAKMDFTKIWPKENTNTHPVRFKMFYQDGNNLVELPEYAFGMDDSNTATSDYDYNPQQQAGSTTIDDEIRWKSNITIPVTVTKKIDNKTYSIPLYKLKYNGPDFTYDFTTSATESSIAVANGTVLDPSKVEDLKKLYAISHESEKRVKNGQSPIELEIVEWNIVIKEYDKDGNEVSTAEFLNISGKSVTVSNDVSIPIDVIDAGGVGKTIKGYNINFSSITFASQVKNTKGPIIEKYIRNKVHDELMTFDEIFDYEIMVYVPLDAEEVIIYDTLETPLMFVSNSMTHQYVDNSNSVNPAFASEYNNNPKFFMIKNEANNNWYQLEIMDKNDHYGDGYGTVNTNGTAFTNNISGVDYNLVTNPNKNNPMNAGTLTIGTLTKDNATGNVNGVVSNANGNSLYIKIDNTSGIEAVKGKWVKAKFFAAIKPEYRDLAELRKIGWLENEDLKVGSPSYVYEKNIVYSGSGWTKLAGIEKLVGRQFIVDAAAQNVNGQGEVSATHRYAKDRFDNYYAYDITASDAEWFKVTNDTSPNLNTAKARLGEGGGRNNFEDLDISTSIEYKHYDDFVLDGNTTLAGHKFANNSNIIIGDVTAKRGAYGNGDWMFLEDSAGNYYYAIKSENVELQSNGKYKLKEGVTQVNWIKVSDLSESERPASLTDQMINDRLSGRDATVMDLTTYPYNWPILDENSHVSLQPHHGEANQVHMVVDAKNTYHSNIVTLNVLQPEKYVNNKVHDVLKPTNLSQENNDAFESFDKPFEYEIMVYVPDNAKEIIIWDTLNDSLMFMDKYNQPQYRTLIVGTDEDTGTDFLNDDTTAENYFMKPGAGDTNSAMTIIEYSQLQYYTENDHKGDGTGTVSTNGTQLNEPINAGNIKIGSHTGDLNWDSIVEDRAGNSIYLKIDEQSGINKVQGKWVKFAFDAKIKPSAYPKLVDKISKDNRYTTIKTDAIDYDSATDTATVVGYYYRPSQYTIYKMNAVGYDIATDTATPAGYYTKDNNGNYTVSHTGTPLDGTDYIYFYECDYIYYTDDASKIPSGAESKPLYVRRGWNDPDNNTTGWEKINDDGSVTGAQTLYDNATVYKYADVQKDLSHAGLANKANYGIRIDNEWDYITTNTVTVVPLLRTISITKIWSLENNVELPTPQQLLEKLELYWEKVESSQHGKRIGNITELYKDKITITARSQTTSGDKTRYYWTIEVRDLPRLEENLKYFLKETSKISDEFNAPVYFNPFDEGAKDHAHDGGEIENSTDDGPDKTQLTVEKIWDDGDKTTAQVKVQLLANGQPIIDPSTNEVDESTIVTLPFNDSWKKTWDGLDRFERDSNGDYIELPVTDESRAYYYDPVMVWDSVYKKWKCEEDANGKCKVVKNETDKNVYKVEKNKYGNPIYMVGRNDYYYDPDGNKIPSYERDSNGNKISETYRKEIVYSIKILEDPENYILSVVDQTNKKYSVTTTPYVVEAYDYKNDNPNLVYGYAKVVGGYTRYYDDAFGTSYTDVPFTQELIDKINSNEEDYLNNCYRTGVPSTGPSINCEYCKIEEYDSYEVDLVNTKPQIEKYINKDVHLETYFTNSFTYDIVVYVPREATEIEITDELLPSLKLDSFLEPVITGEENKVIDHYDNRSISSMSESMNVAVHAKNPHIIHSDTIGPVVIGSNKPAVYDVAKANITVDGKSFKVKIDNIVPAEITYLEYEHGEYVEVSKIDGSDTRYMKDSEVTSEYLQVNNRRYRISEQPYYIEAQGDAGTHYKVWNSKKERVQFVTKDTDLSGVYEGYERADDKTYSLTNVTNVDQKIGGYYVQVSFNAKFDLNDEQINSLNQWVNNKSSKSTPNEDFDWDVITVKGNKGWDDYIRSQGLNETDHQYITADSAVPDQVMDLYNALGKENVLKVIKTDGYYAAKTSNNFYVCMINPTQFTSNKDVWLLTDQGISKFTNDERTRYFTLDGEEVEAWENTTHNFNSIRDAVNNGSDITTGKLVVPLEPGEYVKIKEKYYLKDVADLYAPAEDYNDKTIYRKVDWGRGDGDVIRTYKDSFNGSRYEGDHAGIVNTASYEITYGNGYKSSHKSNTVTVVPNIYELPSSGGMGTLLFNMLGTMFITLALIEFTLKKRKRRKSI